MNVGAPMVENIPPIRRMLEVRQRTKLRLGVIAQYVVSIPYLIEYVIVAALVFRQFYYPILIGALVFHLISMGIIIYRSSNHRKVANVFRCVLFGVSIGIIQGVVANETLPIVLSIGLHVALSILTVQVSDYCYHRFLWHANWTRKLSKLGQILWNPVRVHTIHHSSGHHRHYKTLEQNERMLRHEVVHHQAKEQVESKYLADSTALYALRCSDHGVTMFGFECIGSFTIGYMCLPTVTSIIVQLLFVPSSSFLLPVGVWIQMALVAVPVYLNMNHAFYHSEFEARCEAAKHSLFGWFWKSDEMERLAQEHHHHHQKGQRFGVVPFYRHIVSLVFGEH